MKWKKARDILASGRAAKPTNEIDALKERILSLELQNCNLIADKAGLEERLRRTEEKVRRIEGKKGARPAA